MIPTVDLSAGVTEGELAAQIRAACTTAGFFFLAGHGVPAAVRGEAFAASRSFFGLPVAAKRECLADENNRGWNPLGEETLDPAHQSRGDTKEGYYIGREVPAGSAEAELPLHGPNVWPDEAAHPTLSGWRATMEAYHAALTALARRLLPLFALALGLPRDTFLRKGYFDKPVALLRLLRYAPEASTPESGVLACGAHSDYGMFTLLATDGVPGLQILRGGEWVDVPPRPDDFVVNIGDLLQRWSNDVFASTVHRVVNQTAAERFSTPFFFEPNFNCVVECFPQCCVDAGGNPVPPKHAPTTAGRYLLDRYNETHADFVDPTGAKGGAAEGDGGAAAAKPAARD